MLTLMINFKQHRDFNTKNARCNETSGLSQKLFLYCLSVKYAHWRSMRQNDFGIQFASRRRFKTALQSGHVISAGSINGTFWCVCICIKELDLSRNTIRLKQARSNHCRDYLSCFHNHQTTGWHNTIAYRSK